MTPSFFRLSAMAGLVLAVAGRPPHASAQESDIQRLSLDHYLDMESVSNPQISPDGSRVVYTRGWVDRVNDQRKSALWIMNADGSRNRQLLEGG